MLLTTTSYIAGAVYEEVQGATPPALNGGLQFFSTSEGRVRLSVTGLALYDYMLKDHLGNIRTMLTDEVKTDNYLATFEVANANFENQLFANVTLGRVVRPTCFGYPTINGIANDRVQRLGNATSRGGTINRAVGSSIVLKVMAGDKIKASVLGWFQANSAEGNTPSLAPNIMDVVTSLLQSGIFKAAKGTNAGNITTPIARSIVDVFQNYVEPPQFSPNAAYLNYMVINEEDLTPDFDNMGFSRLSDVTAGNACDPAAILQANGGGDINITKNGFIFIYLTNTSTQYPVYFDQLKIDHIRGSLIEETAYYPFGLVMSGISSKAAGSLQNNKKYNGIEFDEDLGLNIYEAFYRHLDPQTGRWWEIDPKIDAGYESITPYNSMFNDPIRYSDFLGDEADDDGILGSIKSGFVSFENGFNKCWNSVVPSCVTKTMDWVNDNLNPLTSAVELATGKSYNSGFRDDKSRLQSGSELGISLIPGGKFEGAIIKTAEKALTRDIVKVIDKEALKRGIKNEEKALAEEGLKKNTKTFTGIDGKSGKDVNTIPDSFKNRATVEVKDAKSVSYTKQLRSQTAISSKNGQKPILITGRLTNVSAPVLKNMTVIRKNYLGPQ